MSFNVFVGAEVDKVLGAGSIEELIALVTEVYYEMLASNPQARMEAIADEIAARMPDCVALQEVTQVLRQSPGDWIEMGTAPAEEPVADFLELLLDSLKARGAHYAVVAVAIESDIELPMLNPSGGLDDVRMIDREAILVRSDMPPGYLRATNARSGHFQYIIEVPELGISVERGWCSVDVFARGREFRYVCAHPEPAVTLPELNYLQVVELMDELSAAPLPIILTGDFNTDPLQRDGSFSYPLFEEAGFLDAWNIVYSGDPEGGLTYGRDYDLSDIAKEFEWRLDLALYRGAMFSPTASEVIDPMLTGGSPPLWPSDHAGLYSAFLIR